MVVRHGLLLDLMSRSPVQQTLIMWMCVGRRPEGRVPHRCRFHSCIWDRPTCVLQVATLETKDNQKEGKLVLEFWPNTIQWSCLLKAAKKG